MFCRSCIGEFLMALSNGVVSDFDADADADVYSDGS